MSERKCIFCDITSCKAPAEIIYEDEHVACIKDIKPASTHHYLIIPKTHVANVKALRPEDEDIFDRMVATIKTVCEQQGFDPKNTRTGFHWPPFTTVGHLHLHVISPIDKMGLISSLIFRQDSYWFVSTDYVKSRFRPSS